IAGGGPREALAAVLQQIVYAATAASATAVPVREITVAVSDGTNTSNTATSFVAVDTGGPTAPVLDLDSDNSSGATGSDYQTVFAEGGPAVKIADVADLSITDAGSATLTSLTASLTNAQNAGEAVALTVEGTNLAASLGLNVSSFSSGVFISGSASVAQYEQLLEQVVYSNASDTPSASAVREIQVSVSDANHASNVATAFVTV